jgi:hypothetical protein
MKRTTIVSLLLAAAAGALAGVVLCLVAGNDRLILVAALSGLVGGLARLSQGNAASE